MSIESGYLRESNHLPSPVAVRWWHVRATAEGEIVFARGGRVATARLARRALAEAREEYQRELALVAELRRPRFKLLPSGDLVEHRLS